MIDRRWRRALSKSILALPLSLPLFIAYQAVALPFVLVASLIMRRNMLPLTVRLIKMAPLDWLWYPFFRLLTATGRERCEYVDMRSGADGLPYKATQGSPTVCTVDSLPPQPANCARLVFVSDTHGKHEWVDVPSGDALFHAGDITIGWHNRFCCCRSAAALRSFDAWLGSLPHRHKVVIGGNHDAPLEQLVADTAPGSRPFANATYLENSGVTLQLPGGRSLRVWGTPWSAPGSSANQAFRVRSAGQRNLDAPPGVDVLLSHSELPKDLLQRVAPRVAASGHFHDFHGVRFHGASAALSEQAARLYGSGAKAPVAFAPPPGHGQRLDVNCALCDTDYSTTQRVVVVDLPVEAPQQATAAGGKDVAAGSEKASGWGLNSLLSRWK